jgi:peroxiredoxin
MAGMHLVLLALFCGVTLAGGWLGWQLLHQNGRLLLRLDELEKRLDELEFGDADAPPGLPLGREAPAFELPDLAGDRKSLAQFHGQPVLLLFFNPACDFCREMMPKLAALHKTEGSRQQLESESSVTGNGSSSARPQILIVSTGSEEANRQLFDEHKVTHSVLLQKEMEVAAAYQANGTPSGYLIDAEGKIASGLAIGAEALLEIAAQPRSSRGEEAQISSGQSLSSNGHGEDQSLVTSAATSRFTNHSLARSKIKRDGLKAGTPAPDFRLPRLDGRGELSLSELRGRCVLLVFSSPQCGPCNTLAPELEKFHHEHPELKVLMISKGEPKENRAKVNEHGLTFQVVLQQQWEISRRYAMFATPIAYLIDEQGVIAQDVAVGTDAIQKLISNYSPSTVPDELEMTSL